MEQIPCGNLKKHIFIHIKTISKDQKPHVSTLKVCIYDQVSKLMNLYIDGKKNGQLISK